MTEALNGVINSIYEQILAVRTSLATILPPDGASKLIQAVEVLKSLTKDNKVQQAVEKIYKSIDVLGLHQTIRHVNTGGRILKELAKLSVAPAASPKSFGVCLT